jgi:hypothetical protein
MDYFELYLLAYPVLPILVARSWSRYYFEAHPERKFNFYITDYWASIVGMIPSFWIVVFVARVSDGEWVGFIGAAYLALSQICGIIMARNSHDYPHGGSVWKQFCQIILGATCGLFLPIAWIVCLPIILIALILSPVAIAVWLLATFASGHTREFEPPRAKSYPRADHLT